METPNVPIPDLMKSLARDQRGFPVPYIVQRDKNGAPLFIVNKTELVIACAAKKLCSICGGKLTKDLWFVGGPRSAFHPHGVYRDPPVHYDCMRYALQVCPYLAMPSYRSTTEIRLPEMERLHGRLLLDETQDPQRPRVLVAVLAYGRTLNPPKPTEFQVIVPLRPYHAVEFWKHGAPIDFNAGLALAQGSGVATADILSALRPVLSWRRPSA